MTEKRYALTSETIVINNNGSGTVMKTDRGVEIFMAAIFEKAASRRLFEYDLASRASVNSVFGLWGLGGLLPDDPWAGTPPNARPAKLISLPPNDDSLEKLSEI
mmetsp:Transcript_25883/g.54244  ORF Transcript_25883/g.54244 Transcript_25883/m.54244 type:complete len:104 (-) Transcript_25883:241-552(-)